MFDTSLSRSQLTDGRQCVIAVWILTVRRLLLVEQSEWSQPVPTHSIHPCWAKKARGESSHGYTERARRQNKRWLSFNVYFQIAMYHLKVSIKAKMSNKTAERDIRLGSAQVSSHTLTYAEECRDSVRQSPEYPVEKRAVLSIRDLPPDDNQMAFVTVDVRLFRHLWSFHANVVNVRKIAPDLSCVMQDKLKKTTQAFHNV